MEQTDLPGLTFQLAILPLSWREEQEGNKIFLHSKKCIREGLSHLPKGNFLFVYKAQSLSLGQSLLLACFVPSIYNKGIKDAYPIFFIIFFLEQCKRTVG